MDHSDLQGSYSHSSEIRRASELPRLDSRNIVQIGVRGYNFAESFRFVESSGITQFTPEDVLEIGVPEVTRKTLEIACDGTESVYLTFDIDAFDPAFAPGTGGDDPFGLAPSQVFPMLEAMAPAIGCMDIAEVNPACDRNDISSLISAKIIFKIVLSKYCLP
jgi:formiminoglutamase/agmatinase